MKLLRILALFVGYPFLWATFTIYGFAFQDDDIAKAMAKKIYDLGIRFTGAAEA